LALQTNPRELKHVLESKSTIADTIWRFAEDDSTDMTWYTRRGILIGIYSAAEVYMITDKSSDFIDTFNFVEERLKEMLV